MKTAIVVLAYVFVLVEARKLCLNPDHLQCDSGRLNPLLVILRGVKNIHQIYNGCYKASRRCDDWFDCQDRSDEIGCSAITLSSNEDKVSEKDFTTIEPSMFFNRNIINTQ